MFSVPMEDVQQKHKETLRAQTETLRVNTILMREKVKVFQLADRYAELTVISTVRDRRLVEHELLARGRAHEEWREKHLHGELEKIRTDQLFQSSFSRSKSKSGSSAAVAGVAGIGKTTMVQKIVYDWATGKIYQQFQFVFSFKFRDLNSINCRINLRELILDQYPYFGNILRKVWKNPEGLLFIFDGLDEFKHTIDFADSRRDTEPKHQCPDPEWWCEVSDIVYSLIQGKLLPGCSVLVTTQENEILYTMSYNPSYCWILALALGPFFTQRVRDPQRVPKTITQLYSYFIYNILKNHGREIENPRDVLLRVGQMAFRGVSEKKIVFTDEDLVNFKLQPSQFLSGFLMELLEREDSARSVVYTFPHLTIQEFVAAVAQFLNPHPGDILKFLTEAHNTSDGRFEVFLRFVAGNDLGDSGVKLVSVALRNPECKIQKLELRDVGLTDSGAKELVSALSTNPSLMRLNLSENSLTDRSRQQCSRLPHVRPQGITQTGRARGPRLSLGHQCPGLYYPVRIMRNRPAVKCFRLLSGSFRQMYVFDTPT
ncbi:NACHT, LRR and PYD domains-containing protein 3-like [Hypanus sabinus]|uniref:NACHT, LRR and PYD domains-containing protein 3-like n=1 Tax=Hypanus sabinus TaxID=79690 RepID=UPI0028C3807B|nr:NACHT, LRR and PYD domains-containing protein 3-like [Hypanus sabinus]